MKLDAWVDKTRNGRARKDVLADLAKVSGVAFQTLAQCERGARISLYEKALAIQEATGGQVTVLDLCDPEPQRTFETLAAQFDNSGRGWIP